MQSQMASQPAPRGTSLLKQLLLLILLVVLLAVIYCNNVAFFNQAGAKVRDYVAAVVQRACTAANPWADEGDAVAFHPRLEKMPPGQGNAYPPDAGQPPPQYQTLEQPRQQLSREEPQPQESGPLLASPDAVAPLPAAPAPAAAPAPDVTPQAPVNETVDGLVAARGAFARGDMQAAIEAYRAYVALNPESMAGHGELGNVYYALGMLPGAAQSYFEAANAALAQGQAAVAERLLPVIHEGNPALATRLYQRLHPEDMRGERQRTPPRQGAYPGAPQFMPQDMAPDGRR